MALDVVDRFGRTGRIFIKESRQHGARILLVCEPLHGSGVQIGGTMGPSVGVGVVLEPDEEEQPPRPGGWVLPIDEGETELAVSRAPFEVRVDTSGLAAGLHRFNMDRFLLRAIVAGASADPAELTTVELSPANGREWGWQQLPPNSPLGGFLS